MVTALLSAVSLWEYMIMMTVNIVFKDGTEQQFTWNADTSQLSPVNNILSDYITAIEILSYQPE